MYDLAINESTLTGYFFEALKPDKEYTVSEWADDHRVLSRVSSAEPGKFRTARTPYLKDIMDDLSVHSPITHVVFMKGAQVGATELGNNFVGYVIDYAPGPMLSIMPREEDAKKNSKIRITPMIEASDRLTDKVRSARSKDSGGTILQKDFPSGVLYMAGANSAAGLRSMPVRYLFLDEVDEYPGDLEGQGDPVALAIKRTNTFSSKKKIYEVSTPTIEGQSRIAKDFERTDKRYYFVPCPHCGFMQTLEWGNMRWTWGQPDTVRYICDKNGCEIENWQKGEMLAKGEWRPTATGAKPTTRGYHLNSLYSPVGWLSWSEIVEEWEEARDTRDLDKLKTFINTNLGETWKDAGEKPEYKDLYARREDYETNSIPNGVCFLTAGVDVQEDRIEVEVVGWGRNKQSWSIDYRIFLGDTIDLNGPAWRDLEALVNETWRTPRGIDLPLRMMGIDSGYRTQTVYNFVRKFSISKVIALKGKDEQPITLSAPRDVDVKVANKRRKIRRGIKLFTVGSSVVKAELYGWLKQPKPEPNEETGELVYPYGYCHFPENYDEEHYKRLTSEEQVTTFIRGHKKVVWQKDNHTRNEQLDCRVYARAAANAVGLDRYRDEHWDKLEREVGFVAEQVAKEPKSKEALPQAAEGKPAVKITPRRAKIVRRKSTFMR